MNLNTDELQDLISLFHKFTGIRYTEEKIYLFQNRLSKFITPSRFSNYREFIDALKRDKNGHLREEFINQLTTNFTYFFREPKHFRFLQHVYIHKFHKEREIRLWSAAASGGHEAYSMAISLEPLSKKKGKPFRIIGTDIALDKIDHAREGLYKKTEIENYLHKRAIDEYFTPEGENLRVKNSIKNRVQFNVLNIMGAYPFKKEFHIIFLRNILIYFKKEEKEQILNKLANYLHPHGYLVISLSESLTGLKVPFKHVKHSIYVHTKHLHDL